VILFKRVLDSAKTSLLACLRLVKTLLLLSMVRLCGALIRGANPPSQYGLSWGISLFNFVIVKALYLPPLEVTFKFRLCHQLNGGIFNELDLGEGSLALIVGKM
jgi:hypothetical protein